MNGISLIPFEKPSLWIRLPFDFFSEGGSKRVDEIIKSALEWDVMGGVARRSWARNENSMKVITEWNEENKDRGYITLPNIADDDLISSSVKEKLSK